MKFFLLAALLLTVQFPLLGNDGPPMPHTGGDGPEPEVILVSDGGDMSVPTVALTDGVENQIECVGNIAAASPLAKKRPFLNTAYAVATLPFWPLVISAKLVLVPASRLAYHRARFKKWKFPLRFQNFRHDIIPGVIYAALTLGINASPAEILSRSFLGSHHTSLVNPETFNTARGPVVGMNVVDSSSPDFRTYDFLTGATQEPNPQFFQIKPTSFREAVTKLVEARKQFGQPIKKWVLAVEGEPGSFKFGSERIDAKWIAENRSFLDSLPRDLFAPGAEAHVLGSLAGATIQRLRGTQDGAGFLQTFFGEFFRDGGMVLAPSARLFFDVNYIPEESLPTSYGYTFPRDWRRVGFEFREAASAAEQVVEFFEESTRSKLPGIRHIKIKASSK